MPKRTYTRRKSGFHGVYVRPKNKKTFQVQIKIKIKIDGTRKLKNLGSYVTAEQAAKAFDKEAIKLRRPLYKLNYPEIAPIGYTPIQQALRSTNTVGYRGVYKMRKKYQAKIRIAGKSTYIGTYATAKEAAMVYDRAVRKANKPTTLWNFTQEEFDIHKKEFDRIKIQNELMNRLQPEDLVDIKVDISQLSPEAQAYLAQQVAPQIKIKTEKK